MDTRNATIIAALRLWQRGSLAPEFVDLATHNGELPRLNNLEIDEVIKEFQTGRAVVYLPPNQEMDVDLVFPNGKTMQLQYRLESPSIDVCLPTECDVTCWQGDDMEPAKASPEFDGHVRFAKQLVIDFDPDWVVAEFPNDWTD